MKVILLVLSFVSLNAFADHYDCSIAYSAIGSVSFDFDGQNVTGLSASTEGGQLTEKSHDLIYSLDAGQNGGFNLDVGYYPAHDIESVNFPIAEGAGKASTYEMIDCLGESNGEA